MSDAFGDPKDEMVDIPVPFRGTQDEVRRNLESHSWRSWTNRCVDCEARYGSTTSFYACGAAIPRTQVKRGSPEAQAAVRRSLGGSL